VITQAPEIISIDRVSLHRKDGMLRTKPAKGFEGEWDSDYQTISKEIFMKQLCSDKSFSAFIPSGFSLDCKAIKEY